MSMRSTETMSNGEQFLATFTEIEHWLKKMVGSESDRHEEFGRLMRRAEEKGKITPQQADWLNSFKDLRNSIVHNFRGRETIIANPTEATVEKIHSIATALQKPPTAGQFVQGQKVVEFSLTDQVTAPLQAIRDYDYSQFPLRQNGEIVDLLTTNTVARWLAEQFSTIGDLAAAETLEEVRQYKEGIDGYKLVGRNTLLVDVLAKLDIFRDGQGCAAVIVTHSGRPSEAALGLVTIADAAQCLKEING